MLKIARVLLLGLLLIFWFLFGLLLCLVRPRHPNNVYVFARMYHAVCPLIGLRVKVTVADEVKSVGPAVYVCNHQSNFDIFTVTGAVQPGVVAGVSGHVARVPEGKICLAYIVSPFM